jgi:rhamnose utilization protein RhaD (predicted bifunctional aldolase and dehydrogenase)
MEKDPESDNALDELIGISREVGGDPDLVQGGGGNTSVKTRDGRRIFVKASGTSLSAMDRERGWAELELESLRSILTRKGLGRRSPARRESEVLRLLGGAVVQPAGARPSVESNLHALLDRVVIHTHPVGLNALLSSRESRKRATALAREVEEEPLYVPYVDPGYVLAARVAREIAAYRRRSGRLPAVVLLENHGLFVAAHEPGECLALSRALTDAGRRFVGGRRINPLRFDLNGNASSASELVKRALLAGGAAPGIVARDASRRALDLLRSPGAVRSSLRGAFTPDQIVYCRTHPLLLAPRDRGARRRPAGEAWLAAATGAVAAYRKRFFLDPRVVIAPGLGLFYSASDAGQLRIVAEVYRSVLATLLSSPRAGGPRFLTRPQARFIEGWEVEAFRARLAAGPGS